VRPHAVVLFSEAPLATRIHAREQIERLAKNDTTAVDVLKQFAELRIDLVEHIVPPSLAARAAKIDRTVEYEPKTYKLGERQKRPE